MREDILARGEDPSSYPILNSRPEMFSELVWVWEGFLTISASRQMGFNGPQPISLSEVLAFLTYRGISDPEEREQFLTLVQALDQVFIADSIAKQKTKSSQPPGETPLPP